MRNFILALGALLVAAAPPPKLPNKLPAVDQCSADPGFAKFHAALTQAVAKEDRDALLALMAEDMEVGGSEDTGPEAFAGQTELDDPPTPIWIELDELLRGGCAKDGAARVIPGLAVQLKRYPHKVVADKVVILPGTKLYKEAGVESAKSAIAPWTVATVVNTSGDFLTGVRLPDGRQGFVGDYDYYSLGENRLVIEKRGDRWLITRFVADD